jgi:hypothetical protein
VLFWVRTPFPLTSTTFDNAIAVEDSFHNDSNKHRWVAIKSCPHIPFSIIWTIFILETFGETIRVMF